MKPLAIYNIVCLQLIYKFKINTVKPAHVVTCIKRYIFSCPVIENFICIEPLLRGHSLKRPHFLCPKGDFLIQVEC